MAPEQLEGRAPTTRTDIFAFGAVLYEMGTGRKAFEATTPGFRLSARFSRARRHPVDTRLRSALGIQSRYRDISCEVPGKSLAVGRTICLCNCAGFSARHPRRVRGQSCAERTARGESGMRGASSHFSRWPLVEGSKTDFQCVVDQPRPSPRRCCRWTCGCPPNVRNSRPAMRQTAGWLCVPALIDGTPKLALRRLEIRHGSRWPEPKGRMASFWSRDSRSIAFEAGGKLRNAG